MAVVSLEMNNNIAYVTIQSPPANALSTVIFTELEQQLNIITENKSVKAVIVKGEGRFFSAGADIKEFTALKEASEFKALAQNSHRIFERMEHFHIPIIAAIHGAALGGGLELAMACHMRIVSEKAVLGLPEITLGIIPGFAGTQRLPELVGKAKAYELILTGEPIKGIEAHRIGLANQVVSEDKVLETAEELAAKIVSKSKPTITHVMELVPYAKKASFAEGSDKETDAFGEVFGNEDAKEGISAFLEKRKPTFQDK